MQICSVCSEQTPKYRCPACRLRYCSLGCYKKHKDSCSPAEQPPPPPPAPPEAPSAEPWSVEDLLGEDDYTDKVPPEKLKRLGASRELRDLLSNPHLRQLLRSLDGAGGKADAMRAAMQEPLFAEFADQCLQTVEGDERWESESGNL